MEQELGAEEERAVAWAPEVAAVDTLGREIPGQIVTMFHRRKRADLHGLTDGVAVNAEGGDRRRAVAKVCDLDEAVAVQEHVAGLDVAVDGVLLLVQIPQAAQHLRCYALQRRLRELLPGEGGAVDD